MAWKSDRFPRYLWAGEEERPFRLNEKCLIRKEHKCGKIFGASKSCFVACPNETNIEPIIELITEKLAKVGIESVIAVKERAYGQDIFCTKICGKIIEAKFCLVILDDAVNNNINIPNPNVYYEYGLMTSLHKHIIPLQKEGLKLAFNIQSHDTIKYTPTNIGPELDRAVKDAIKMTDITKERGKREQYSSEKSILRNFELAGFDIKDDKWILSDVIDDTGFKGLGQHSAGFYLYLGKVDEENEAITYLEDLSVVLFRTTKKLNELREELKMSKTESFRVSFSGSPYKLPPDKLQERIKLIENTYVGFIISSKVEKSKFIEKAKKVIAKYSGFKMSYNEEEEIEFEGVKVSLAPIVV